MSRSLAKSGKAIATKLLKEKWLSMVQSTREKGENEVGGSSTVTRILEVIGTSWANSTKVLYGNALLVYHIYCDLNGSIPNHERCPILRTLLLTFLSSCAGGASGSALANYTTGIKAWHLL